MLTSWWNVRSIHDEKYKALVVVPSLVRGLLTTYCLTSSSLDRLKSLRILLALLGPRRRGTVLSVSPGMSFSPERKNYWLEAMDMHTKFLLPFTNKLCTLLWPLDNTILWAYWQIFVCRSFFWFYSIFIQMNFTNEQNQFVKTFCGYLYCIHFNWKSFSNWGSRTLKRMLSGQHKIWGCQSKHVNFKSLLNMFIETLYQKVSIH